MTQFVMSVSYDLVFDSSVTDSYATAKISI